MYTLGENVRTARWGVRIIIILVVIAAVTSSGLAQTGTPVTPVTPGLPPGFPVEGGSPQVVLPVPIGSGLLHVNGLAFRPTHSDTSYVYSGVSLNNLGASPATFQAAINLPHGAEIVKVIFVYIDGDNSYDITMSLDVQPFGDVIYGHMAEVTSSGQSYYIQYAEVTNISARVIDNSCCTYLLTTILPPSLFTYLISVRIEYSYSNFAPLIRR